MSSPHASRSLTFFPALFTLGASITALNPRPVTGQAPSTRLLRTPSVSAQHVAFAYANNIWVAERSGGSARRLTSFQGLTQNPKLSPDGKTIAFTAEYAGNSDVYVVPVDGGQPTRLTWHPGADLVQGWSPDGRNIMFASARATWAANSQTRFWMVPITGGVETALPMPRANQGKLSPDGQRVAYRMPASWDDERRNYRGGQNRPIWIMDLKTYAVDTTPFAGTKETDPAWMGDVVYFLSDRDGVSNVWSFDTKSRKLSQVTKFTDFDVKSLDAGAGVVVFEQAGYLHEYDPATGRAKQLAISAVGDFPWMMAQWKDVSSRITSLALSTTGKRAAVEARGEIFTIPAEKGDVRNLTNSSGSAEIAPLWSPDGRSVAYFSDKSGEYRLTIVAQEGVTPPRVIALPEPSRPYSPAWSPNGKKIAYQDTHFRIWVLDVAAGVARIADTDPYFMGDRSIVPVWSSDSRWLAYPKRLKSLFRAIFAYDVETGVISQMTDGLADATSPAWDAGGKHLWFLASTNFALNSSLLDMSKYDRPETRSLYVAILNKRDSSPLLPESDEESQRVRADSAAPMPDSGARTQPASAPSTTATVAPAPVRAVTIDFDGMAQRIVAVPGIADRDYTQLRAGPAGTVFFVEQVAATGREGGPVGGTLHRFQLSARRAAPFVPGVVQYVVSGDGRKLLYRTGGAQGGLYLVDSDRAVPATGAGKLTATLRAYIDPREEFKQIFNEGWRNQRNNLYVQNLHGTDWAAMKKMYEPLLAHVMHRADLNYLMDNMGAEIAIGHSYVRGGDLPEVPNGTGGLLGADFAVENGRYRITRIYDAESWNPELRAPLATPGMAVAVGDYLLSINGVELRAPDNMYRLLDGTANRQVVLTVGTRPDAQGSRQITVVPIANEQGLRTRAWVERNRRIVDSISSGTIAYVYLPNTGQPGYTSFNRYYFAQQDRKGVVVDERYNGGGSAADYIVDLLGRDYDGYFNNPVGERYPYTSPANGIWGPKVMIINEMAGSGGDLMPYMFKRRKLGPLVGTRTWGGLVATTDTPPFVDGGSMIAPRFGFFSREGKFAVENEGVAPDIDVENWPKDAIAGRDAQLERAVAEAMKMLKAQPGDRMSKEPAPPTWGKRGGK